MKWSLNKNGIELERKVKARGGIMWKFFFFFFFGFVSGWLDALCASSPFRNNFLSVTLEQYHRRVKKKTDLKMYVWGLWEQGEEGGGEAESSFRGGVEVKKSAVSTKQRIQKKSRKEEKNNSKVGQSSPPIPFSAPISSIISTHVSSPPCLPAFQVNFGIQKKTQSNKL